MRKLSVLVIALILVGASTLMIGGVNVAPARAADHRDGPNALADGRTDIGDTYIFPAKKRNYTVMVMTVDPFAGLLSPTTFNDAATYEFKIDNTGDNKVDTIWTAEFSGSSRGAAGRMTVSQDGKNRGSGAVDSDFSLRGGGTAMAGMFDDPFYFDAAAAGNDLQFCPGGVGSDFFAFGNIMAIILEVPTKSLFDGAAQIGFWGATRVNARQIDRIGGPFVNLFLLPTSALMNKFNKNKQPHRDPKKFGDVVTQTIQGLGADAATAAALAGLLLPDVMAYSTAAAAGFPNGRGLADDVTDVNLMTLTGDANATDCVDSNDKDFSSKFPYLAPAH